MATSIAMVVSRMRKTRRVPEQSKAIIQAERDRYKAALNTIAYESIGLPEASYRDVFEGCVKIARAALAKGKGAGGMGK